MGVGRKPRWVRLGEGRPGVASGLRRSIRLGRGIAHPTSPYRHQDTQWPTGAGWARRRTTGQRLPSEAAPPPPSLFQVSSVLPSAARLQYSVHPHRRRRSNRRGRRNSSGDQRRNPKKAVQLDRKTAQKYHPNKPKAQTNNTLAAWPGKSVLQNKILISYTQGTVALHTIVQLTNGGDTRAACKLSQTCRRPLLVFIVVFDAWGIEGNVSKQLSTKWHQKHGE